MCILWFSSDSIFIFKCNMHKLIVVKTLTQSVSGHINKRQNCKSAVKVLLWIMEILESLQQLYFKEKNYCNLTKKSNKN